jgi:hypothetical protein
MAYEGWTVAKLKLGLSSAPKALRKSSAADTSKFSPRRGTTTTLASELLPPVWQG